MVAVSYNGRNIFLSAERQISAKAGRSGGTKRLRCLRLINASSRWRSAAHQALEAYVSLEIITDRYMVCNDESSIPCACNTLKAYRACAQELMMRRVCSATDRLLVKVSINQVYYFSSTLQARLVMPRILITVTRLIFGRSLFSTWHRWLGITARGNRPESNVAT